MPLSRVWCSWSTDNRTNAEYFFSKKTEFRAMIIVPALRVGMQFVTLRVTLNARLIPVPVSDPSADATQDL
ncbi:hypothetical protein SAMN05216596_101545 [Pseudomonas congelans]|uniref:Uncharacterized protein n=1 Tax=Pseudomonas congelans TaxID=200452 RepID=A0A1H0JZV4_9PSED|nr:hypothetical protein SAMN05216596_101545 [Pseudomonas congelans]